MYSVTDVMREAMISDVPANDIDPATIVAAYPTKFSDVSDVPEYMYQSLETIWQKDISKAVITELGAGTTSAEGNIVLVEVRVMDAGQVSDSGFDFQNAESAEIDIVFQKPRNLLAAKMLKNAELRTRLLLDYNIRQNIRLIQPDLPTTETVGPDLVKFDPTLDIDYWCKCFWRGYAIEPTNSHVIARYRTEYVRMFLYV